MSREVLYHCSHSETPHAPLPPSHASSYADLSPLSGLFFCEECDAIRCDQCVAVEVASYYCPNCLFDVPSANVRADKNRCARSCFACPLCSTSLTALASETPAGSQIRDSISGDPNASSSGSGGSYHLICPGCKWSSKDLGWTFDKPAGLAGQVSKIHTLPDDVQTEFDALKDHLEAYMRQSAPRPGPGSAAGHRRAPSRNIAQITQAARGALRRDMAALVRPSVRRPDKERDGRASWDEMKVHAPKATWRQLGVERGFEDVEEARGMQREDVAGLEKRWATAWEPPRKAENVVPERIPLQAKLTKRCPHPTCRHILIQPDTKTVRMLIKMVATNYLPTMEIGRRRRQLRDDQTPLTDEDIERRRRDRRKSRLPNMGPEVDEDMHAPLQPGEVYTFQLAFTNPLYDPIQIRLGSAHQGRGLAPPNNLVFIPTVHFTVGASKDVWAYDDEEGSEEGAEDDITAGEAGKPRVSLLSGSLRNRSGVEKRGNVTKVPVEVEVVPGAEGPVDFDLEIRFTYRVEEEGEEPAEEGKEEFKTFTFWTRMSAGQVA